MRTFMATPSGGAIAALRSSNSVKCAFSSTTAPAVSGDGAWKAMPPATTDASDWVSSLKPDALAVRSEEHTSELQSLMRISYAVFCLKKKKKNITSNHKKQKN